MTIYFTNHFYFGSEINGINVSGKSVEEVNEQMTSELLAHTLNLKERWGRNEQIKAAEVGLKYSPDEQIKNFKDSQNPFNWVLAIFNTEDSKMTMTVSFDEKLLKEKVDKLSCFQPQNIVEPKNPIFIYKGGGYVIVNEIGGNKVNKDILFDQVVNALLDKKTEIDLESIGCYIKPQYTSTSPKIIEAKDILNKYASSRITYTFGDHEEIIDGSTISKWLKVDENYEVAIDEEEERNYMAVLSNNYSVVGRVENFLTSSGAAIDIRGGDYSRMINADKEVQEISGAIKEGKTIKKEPSYVLSTYVEIDLTKQHLWFYKDGSLITEGDIVSGDLSKNMATPGGIYRLKAVVKDAILRGPGYAAPVDFWMPFNGGIGIHDATWRGRFGGNIYKYDGSHGCINCPYSLAKTIFENIKAGTPVICYY